MTWEFLSTDADLISSPGFPLLQDGQGLFCRLLWGSCYAWELLWHKTNAKYYCFEISPLLYHCYHEQQQKSTQMLKDVLCWDYFPCCSFKLGVSIRCRLLLLCSYNRSWTKLWWGLEAGIKVCFVLAICLPFWWPWKRVAAIIPSLLFLIAPRVSWCKANATTPSYLV